MNRFKSSGFFLDNLFNLEAIFGLLLFKSPFLNEVFGEFVFIFRENGRREGYSLWRRNNGYRRWDLWYVGLHGGGGDRCLFINDFFG